MNICERIISFCQNPYFLRPVKTWQSCLAQCSTNLSSRCSRGCWGVSWPPAGRIVVPASFRLYLCSCCFPLFGWTVSLPSKVWACYRSWFVRIPHAPARRQRLRGLEALLCCRGVCRVWCWIGLGRVPGAMTAHWGALESCIRSHDDSAYGFRQGMRCRGLPIAGPGVVPRELLVVPSETRRLSGERGCLLPPTQGSLRSRLACLPCCLSELCETPKLPPVVQDLLGFW